MKINTLKMLFSVMMLIFGVKAFAQDEIFLSGFEPVPQLLLEATPESIAPGDPTTLTWSVIEATSCVKSGDWSGIAAAGTGIFNEVVTPNVLPAVYSIQCTNSFGASPLRSVAISQTPAVVSPPALSFTANPTSIDPGEQINLFWSSTNAEVCTTFGPQPWGNQTVSLNGVFTLAPLNLPATYSMQCSNQMASTPIKSITIQETSNSEVPTLSISASPTTIPAWGSSTISWNITNADTCVRSGNWGGIVLNDDGSYFQNIPNIVQSSIFSMQCANENGSTPIKSVQIIVQ